MDLVRDWVKGILNFQLREGNSANGDDYFSNLDSGLAITSIGSISFPLVCTTKEKKDQERRPVSESRWSRSEEVQGPGR